MKLTYKDPAKNNWFLVSWTLSNKCNYRCEYCPDILHNGSTGQPQWSTVKRFVQNFNLKDKKICYRLSGGEPTYWKHFIDLAELVKEEGHKFTFVSNGSQSPEYFKKIAPYTDGMMLSYHKAYANPEHFIKIINESKIETVINMMLLPSDFEEIFALAEKIYSSTARASIVPKVIVDKTSSENITNEVMTYTEAQKQLIRGHEFHYWGFENNLSELDLRKAEHQNELSAPWKIKSWETEYKNEGFFDEKLHASWIHLHLPSSPEVAKNFIDATQITFPKQN